MLRMVHMHNKLVRRRPARVLRRRAVFQAGKRNMGHARRFFWQKKKIEDLAISCYRELLEKKWDN